MLVLGIESSCDETGVALVRTQSSGVPVLLAHALHSQIEMHQAYGGVVPELASRDHIRRVLPLAEEVLAESGCRLPEVDVVAYTRGPGLAGRSAEAAKEVKTLISDSVDKVGVGSEQVALAGATMQEIVAGIQRVADIVGEIASSSREQAMGLGQINQAVAHLDGVTQQNAALVEETSAASSALQEQARHLAALAATFRLQ